MIGTLEAYNGHASSNTSPVPLEARCRHASSGTCSVPLEAYRRHASSGTCTVPLEAHRRSVSTSTGVVVLQLCRGCRQVPLEAPIGTRHAWDEHEEGRKVHLTFSLAATGLQGLCAPSVLRADGVNNGDDSDDADGFTFSVHMKHSLGCTVTIMHNI